MAVDRRTTVLAGALVIALVVATVVWTSGGSTNSPASAPPPRAAAPAAQGRGSAPDAPAHVNLEALESPRGQPADAGRNPFRFEGPTAPKPAEGESSAPPQPVNATPMMVAPPTPVVPPPPPIPLKFIGIVTQGAKRLAVLSDGRSTPQSGEEGAIILGQYRILKIGNESIEMAYVDGRGRQTIRLTGQ
jgi:hypothetical protein